MDIYITGIDKHTLATYLNSKGHTVLIDIPKYTGEKRVVEIKTPQGEWIKMPHKECLPWDCPGEYENPTYDEKDHSVVEWWWHCSKCFYEMSRDGKPNYNFCPNCGARMKGADNEVLWQL